MIDPLWLIPFGLCCLFGGAFAGMVLMAALQLGARVDEGME